MLQIIQLYVQKGILF